MACNNNSKCRTLPLCCNGSNSCQKTCIEARKVFDACIQQNSQSTTLTVTFPPSTSPTKIISVTNSSSGTISDLVVTPMTNTSCSRVTYTLTVPITVVATDAAGNTLTGTSSMVFNKDIVMRVPQVGVIQPQVEATAVVVGLNNTISTGNVLTTEACVTIITKVVADVILVVPSYGYAVLPPCQEYTEDVCSGVFGTSIFPR